MTLEYKATHQQFRFINAHLPGNPLKPARFEFAKYLVNTLDLKMTTVAMGDMNFKAYQMEEGMSSASEEALFTIYSPYCTNVSIAPEFKSKAIDHFIIHSELDQKVLAPNEVMEELAPAVDLLNREISNLGVK